MTGGFWKTRDIDAIGMVGFDVLFPFGAKGLFSESMSLVFQNPPVIPCVCRCLEPLKAEPQELFVSPNTYKPKVFGRLGCMMYVYLHLPSKINHKSSMDW